ncbi:hypothetical protein QLQ12_44720 [Actinoplanes sp. NEAU-A12]|uniref:Uncharacterized protein n=1 Tax=Actinoplanes sandaracinus TaxID=3045177 RepID=A0ABT6X112_9ACTN|nr:hypothetical protein [Actinoplanes sandaracinus]MDI6105707.1 hypothetical protein [Actinoplanes sandaracinus]
MFEKLPVDVMTDSWEILRYDELGDEAPEFDLIRNDLEHCGRGAHTLDRHGPDIPLRRTAGAKTIEGRIYGDPPWRGRVSRSYQWTDLPTLNYAVNTYVRRRWTVIRIDLARRHCHVGLADAGRLVGQGYDSTGVLGRGPERARYREVSQFKVCIRLPPKADPAVPFILSAFPWSSRLSTDAAMPRELHGRNSGMRWGRRADSGREEAALCFAGEASASTGRGSRLWRRCSPRCHPAARSGAGC